MAELGDDGQVYWPYDWANVVANCDQVGKHLDNLYGCLARSKTFLELWHPYAPIQHKSGHATPEEIERRTVQYEDREENEGISNKVCRPCDVILPAHVESSSPSSCPKWCTEIGASC